MRTSHNDSVKDPRTTAITINEEALHKEEFEFKSQTKTERALKTLQRLSGLTTLLSTYQLIPMTLSLANDPSSFNIISTSLASVSLLLSLGLAYWSTRVLKSEQSRHLLAQDLNWEGLNTGLFVTLLMRAALSLVLIPNFLLQSGNTPSQMVDSGLTTGQSSQINMARTISNLSVPLPLIELMVFFVFLSAAKTTFSHIKQSGRAMSSLIFFANIAMLSAALGLVFSVLRLKAFPFQGNFALIFPSWNLNGLLRLGAIASFTSFVVWLVNFKRWRVPSVFSTMIVGALALGFTALSISGYSNANSVEREHGPEFARPYLGFSNLGMLSAVFGMLVFLGGSYFWKRHYNFIETNRKRNLTGFAVLVGFVLVFAAARTFYWQPFVTSNQGYASTRTYSTVGAKPGPQMTIREALLSQYLLNDLNSLDKGIKDTTKDLNNVITLFENAKRRGFFPKQLTTQLWTFTESLDDYEEYVPKTAAMELWQLFGSLDNLQNQLDDASEGVAENSRAIRSYALQLWPWSKSLPEESEDYKEILPKSGVVSKLWSLFGSLDEAQASLDDAKLQLETTKVLYQDAQNKALVTGANVTEFWPWSSSLGDVESYKNILPEDGVNQLWWFFNKVSSAHTKLKEAAQEVRASTKAIANATTSLWPSRMAALSDYRNYVPHEQELQFWSLFGSVNDVENNLNDVSSQLDEVQKLWSPWANSVRSYKTHEEEVIPQVIPQGISRLWSLFGSLDKTEESLNDASVKASNTKASIEEAQSKGVLPTDKTVEAWSSHWQDNLPSRMVTTTWFSGWHEVSENLPTPTLQDNTTQLWGDHWSVVDKLPSFLRLKSAPTSQSVWNSDYVTEFPREAATQLFLWFGKVNSLENSVNTAKEKVKEVKVKLEDASKKGLIYAENVTSAAKAKLTNEQVTALWSLFGSVNELKDSVDQANEQIKDAQGANLTANTELWPWSDSLNEYDQYEEVLPKIALTELWSLFSHYSDLKQSLNNTAQQIQDTQSQGVWNDSLAEQLPKDISTQFWSLFGSLSDASTKVNEANSKVNSMNNMLSSAQSLGLISKDANVKPTSLEDAASKLNSMNNIKTSAQNLGLIKGDSSSSSASTPTTTATKTGDVGGSLNSLQNQLNSASQKVSNIQSIYNNAQNLGLVAKPGAATPSELWAVSGALNSAQGQLNNANQKLHAAEDIYSSSQNLGLVSRNSASTELFTFWGSLNDAQNSINTANQKLDAVQSVYSNAQNLGLVAKEGATPSEFWSLSETLDKSEEYVPKNTELWTLSSSLNNIQSQINTANQKVSNMKTVYSNAQNLGLVSKDTAPATPSQLWSWSKAVDTVDKYREYLPVETVTAFWSLFSSVSDLEDTIDETNKQFQEATEKGALPAPNATETWTAEWVDKVPKESAIQLWTLWNSLNNVQSSLDNTNQKIGNAKTIYTNAQNLGLVSKDTPAASDASQLWGWSHSLQDSVVPSQLWSLWGSLNDAENSVKIANENLDNVEATYQNALNATESDTTQLWSLFGWLTGAQSSLNTANQKLANAQSVYQNAQNLGLVSKDNTNATANAASNQLWALSNSLNSVQSQLSAANKKVSDIQTIYSNAQNLGLVNKDTGSTTQLWSLFGWLTGAQSSLNTANQKLANVQSIVSNAQNLGLISKDSASASTTATPTTAPTTAPTTELFFLWNWLTGAQNSLNTANQKLANIENIYTNAQNLGLVSKDGSAQTTTSTGTTPTPTPTTELWSWFTNSVNSAQAELNNANQKLANVESVYQNAQNLGLVSKDNTTVAPSELWTLSSSLNSVQSQLNAANRKVSNVKSIYSNAQNLGLVSKQSSPAGDQTTETWTWFKNSLDNAQASLDSASQKVSNVKSVYSNAQNLGLVGTVTPATTPNTTELWALFGWLTGAQSSLNTANQKLSNVQSIVTNAQNLGLISKDSASSATGTTATSPAATTPQTTELWAWFGKSLDSTQATLDDANQKLANAQSVYNNAQNLGLISKDNAAATPETTELWSLFGWLTGAQSSLNTANQKLANAKSIYTNAQNLGLISKDSASTPTTTSTDASTTTPTTAPASVTELFFLWNWLTGAQNSLNTANQKLANVQSIYTNAQNLGLVSKDGTAQTTTQTSTTATPTPTTELWGWFKSSLDSAQSSLNDANQKLANVQSVYNNAQNLGLVNKDNTATPSELWSASKTMDGTLNKYEEYVPKLTEMWAWFSNSLNNVQNQLDSANHKVSSIKSIYSSADNLGQNLGVVVQKQGTTDVDAVTAADTTTPDTTEMWAWFTNSLNNVQSQLNTANQKVSDVKSIYSNAQNLGLVSKDTSSSSTTAPATATPQTTELFFLWNWLTGAQNSLNTANQKLANVQSIYNNAQNLGLVSKDGTTGTTATTTTSTTPTTATTATPSELWSAGQAFNDAMDKYEEYVPKTTELWGWFKSSLDNAQASLNDANQKLNNVQNIYSNAQNLGLVGKDNAATPSTTATPSELWSVGQGFNDAMDKYEEYVPKTTELWAWFSSSLNKAQSQLNAANQKVSDIKNTYSSAETLGNNLGLANNQSTTTATDTTEMWTWFTNSLNNVQNQLNTANQKVSNVKSIYSNAQNLGLVGKDNAATPSTAATPSELWSVGQGFNDAMDKYEEYVPKVVQLWSLFGWLSGAQTSLNDANQKIANVKSIYTNAENLGLIPKTGTNGDASATPTTTTTTATPSQLWSWSQSLDELDDSGVIPKEVIAELWGIFGSLSDLETSVQDANQQIEEAKANYQNSQGELTPEAETKLWSLFGSLSKVESSLNNATDKIENAQNNGLIPSRDTVDDYNAQWLENVSREGATEFWSLFGSLDNLDSSLSDTQDQIQGVKVTYQGAEEQGLIGKEGELTRLFWPFTRPKSNLEVAKEAVQEKAKSAYEAVASAASTSQEKVKNAYDISQEKVKSAYDISQEKVKSAYSTVSTSVSSSAAELKQKAEELTNRAEHVKADVDHARSDSDHINRDSDAIQGKNQGQNQNQNQNQA